MIQDEGLFLVHDFPIYRFIRLHIPAGPDAL